MKSYLKSMVAGLALVATLGSANAVTLTLTGLASSAVGLVTVGATNTLTGGSLYFYSSTTDLAPVDLEGILLAADPVAFFTSKLNAPTAIRGPVAFTSTGAFTSSASSELGAAGNNLYMLIVGSTGAIGAYQNIVVPALGSVLMNPTNMTQDLVGTSTVQNISGTNSGYQLAAVPEPSAVLLGLLGALGFIRRRR
jgi:hypothetical protein